MRPLLLLALIPLAACSTSDLKDVGDAAPTDDTPASTCPAPTGAGTTHNAATIAADETWTAATSPHLVTADQIVEKGATLTLEPCAVVRVKGNQRLMFRDGGKLVAQGTEQQPIRILADEAGKPWAQLAATAPSTLQLAWVELEGGGSEEASGYGTIEVRGDQTKPVQELLTVDHVTVRASAGFGVSLRAGAGFTSASTALTVTGGKKAPIRLQPRLATNIPTGSYTGNDDDVFAVETEVGGNIDLEDVTFRARGVPYRIGSSLTFGELRVGGDRTLTIEPGVVLQFNKHEQAGVFVDPGTSSNPARGALIAVGTAEQPIVFTSIEKTAGAYRGLVFGNKPSAKNRLEHVRIEFAGGESRANSYHCDPSGSFSKSENAALAVFGQPASAFLKDSVIADSAALGVNLAYSGDPVDFMPTNEFVRVAGCKQSTPRSATGSCPASAPCP